MTSSWPKSDDRRNTWLTPPAAHIRPAATATTKARRALTILRRVAHDADPARLRRVMLAEAYASSLIENIDADPADPDSYPGRLETALQDALNDGAALDLRGWHAHLMAGYPDPRMRPGQYRNVNVRVGNWRAPDHQLVPALMERFLAWMDQEPDPLLRALWGHRQFETIHPFADGNGRTGRLLICQTLGAPLIISRHVWHQRGQYYDLLDHGDWTDWSSWLMERITAAAYATAADLRRTPADGDHYRAVRQMINSALPRPGRNASIIDMMTYQNRLLSPDPPGATLTR